MSKNHATKLDEALQKMSVEEDAPQTSLPNEMQIPIGTYIPDSLARRTSTSEDEKKPIQSAKRKRKLVEARLGTFMTMLKDTLFDNGFLTNLEVLSRRMIEQIWEQLIQYSRKDNVYNYFAYEVKTGVFVVYICRRVSTVLGNRQEFSKATYELNKRIDETASVSMFSTIDSYHTQLTGGAVLQLNQWMQRPISRSMSGLSSLGSAAGSSSGCSSPTSSIGGASSGLGIALTPRIHSKNPVVTRLLPWKLIKGFVQSEAVASSFESYATINETPSTGKEMYIFADCTVIALARSLLQNKRFLSHAYQPISPTKRRRDGAEPPSEPPFELPSELPSEPLSEQLSEPLSEPLSDDHTQLIKSLTDYIRFIHNHASELHTDDSVSATTLIERHLQQLLPCACEYLREHEFIGF